jgi:hypothetical protein
VLDVATLVASLIAFAELAGEILDQLGHLPGLPTIFTLLVVDRVLNAAKQLADRLGFAKYFYHFLVPPGLAELLLSPSRRRGLSYTAKSKSARVPTP